MKGIFHLRIRAFIFFLAASSITRLLSELGYEVKALETGQSPDGKTEPEVCHLCAVYSGR